MSARTKTNVFEARLFFGAFLLFAVIIVGAVKNAYNEYLTESNFLQYSEYRDGD